MEEILMDFLSRLPVKSVVRFNCVSKFWNALISQPYFMKKHLNHAKNPASSQKLLSLHCHPKDAYDNRLYFYSSSLSLVQLVKDTRIVDCPPNSNPSYGALVYCSCDGLFLIEIWNERYVQQPSYSDYEDSSDYEDGNDSNLRSTYGLAYDSISDDYKVFRLVLPFHGQNENEIFALKKGSWRIIDETSSSGMTDCSMYSGGEFLPFVYGAFHWLGISSKKLYVVSFNISSEAYGEISLPEIVCFLAISKWSKHKIEVDVGVSVLGGMLSFYYKDGKSFNLWMMKDGPGSWMKLFTIPSNKIYRVIPTYMFSDDQVLLCFKLDSKTMSRFVYRLISFGSFGLSNHISPLDCDDIDIDAITIDKDIGIVYNGIVYTESLISPELGLGV
ncbi:F-box protein CPR30-like [Solanum tuberosum]|uniref:F-box protein CPR30-like n=1 Tax=Solanum tuberosum TaxID=4113 RepID=UPI00073A3F15|nr:PREDICTED: F-box protein CPR30-like [Solanum tuberosum]